MSKNQVVARVLAVLFASAIIFACGFSFGVHATKDDEGKFSEPVIEMVPVYTANAKVSIRGYDDTTCTVEVPNNNPDALWEAWTECDDAMYTAKLDKN